VSDFWRQIVPLPYRINAEDWSKEQLSTEQARKNIELAEAEIRGAPDSSTQFLVEHARRMLESENARQDSVIGRAQSLFFGIALLSFFLTFGASILASTPSFGLWLLVALFFISLIILLQIVALLINVLGVIQGLNYSKAGSSDVARWAQMQSVFDIYRDEAILTLTWYRDASHKNTWRFTRFNLAIRALRNIVFCICALIVTLFAFSLFGLKQTCMDKVGISMHGEIVYSLQVACGRAWPRSLFPDVKLRWGSGHGMAKPKSETNSKALLTSPTPSPAAAPPPPSPSVHNSLGVTPAPVSPTVPAASRKSPPTPR